MRVCHISVDVPFSSARRSSSDAKGTDFFTIKKRSDFLNQWLVNSGARLVPKGARIL